MLHNALFRVGPGNPYTSGFWLTKASLELLILMILFSFMIASNASSQVLPPAPASGFPNCGWQATAGDVDIQNIRIEIVSGVPYLKLDVIGTQSSKRTGVSLLGYLVIDGQVVEHDGVPGITYKDGVYCVAGLLDGRQTVPYSLPLSSSLVTCILTANSISFQPMPGLGDVWVVWDVPGGITNCGWPTSCYPPSKAYNLGTITINPVRVTASSNSPCPGGDIQLTGGPSALDCYSWTGPNGFTSNQQSPTIPNADSTMEGTYTLRGCLGCTVCTDACSCSNTAQTTVSLKTKPTVSVADVTACGGEPATLTAVAGGCPPYTYQWYNGAVPGSSIITDATSSTYSPTLAGTYTVRVTCASGCSAMDDGTVAFKPKPSVSVTEVSVCEGSRAELIAIISPGTCDGSPTYVWKDKTGTIIPGQTGSSLVFPAAVLADAGTYTVEVTCSGCTGTAPAVLMVQPGPTVLGGPDMAICYTPAITLTGYASNFESAEWEIVEGGAYANIGPTTWTTGDPSTVTASFTPIPVTGVESVTVKVKLTVTGKPPCSSVVSSTIQTITIVQKPGINIILLSPFYSP